MSTSYLFLAPGFEEIEAVTPVDVLRRAEMNIRTVAVTADGSLTVAGAHGVPFQADMHINDVDASQAQWLILPGGLPGATNLYESTKLRELLSASGVKIAAICASPAVVLGQLGLLHGRHATCYPGFESKMEGAIAINERVVASPTLITAQGPGVSAEFALAIVAQSAGRQAAEEIAQGMLIC
jgi:4-methyl-5(b-hydroxyethyl)-thiazole monophosphate biosynthesis